MNVHMPRLLPYQWTDELVEILRASVKDRVPYSRIEMPRDQNGALPSRNALIGKMRREGVVGENQQYDWTHPAVVILRKLALIDTQAEIARQLPPDANGRVANYRHVQRKAKKIGVELIPYERERPRIKQPLRPKPKRIRRKAVAPKPVTEPATVPKQMIWGHSSGGSLGLVLRECQPIPPESKISVTPLRLSILELKQSSCRFPLGDPRQDDFAYCGLKKEPGRVYCESHCRISYTSAAEQRRSRAK